MERYIVREPRFGSEYPQGNQTQLTFQNNAVGNNINMIPPESTMYYGGCQYGAEFPNMQRVTTMGYMGNGHFNQTTFPPQNQAGQSYSSGIDPAYLAAYANKSNTMYIASAGQVVNHSSAMQPGQAFVEDYQNRAVFGPQRNKPKTFSPQVLAKDDVKQSSRQTIHASPYEDKVHMKNTLENFQQNTRSVLAPVPVQITKKITSDSALEKNETGKVITTRADKLKALHKTGIRAFSGGVENVLKWHKSLQDIGVVVLYEIVAKCVNIRQGESCAKHLVVRDDSGPAMQVVYYEIDFLLPEIKPPCVVRVIGRMLFGTCRLQAFNVRLASGDDVATLPRRAAIASHHVAKLCKEFTLPL